MCTTMDELYENVLKPAVLEFVRYKHIAVSIVVHFAKICYHTSFQDQALPPH